MQVSQKYFPNLHDLRRRKGAGEQLATGSPKGQNSSAARVPNLRNCLSPKKIRLPPNDNGSLWGGGKSGPISCGSSQIGAFTRFSSPTFVSWRSRPPSKQFHRSATALAVAWSLASLAVLLCLRRRVSLALTGIMLGQVIRRVRGLANEYARRLGVAPKQTA
jgi:hypothetical protein